MNPENNNCHHSFMNSKNVSMIAIVLSMFLIIQAVAVIKGWDKHDNVINQISVSGKAEKVVIPDVATFSVSITKEGKTVVDAQGAMSTVMNAVISEVKKSGVDEKDIKTESYNISPKYEYQQSICTNSYCPPGKTVFMGYEVSQSVIVKVRDTAKAGDIFSKVGAIGVTNLGSLSFAVDNPDSVKEVARAEAINDAKVKAKKLASELGVRLGKLTSFSEGGYYPMYADAAYGASNSVSYTKAAPSPDLPVGQTKITSNVTLYYEIE